VEKVLARKITKSVPNEYLGDKVIVLETSYHAFSDLKAKTASCGGGPATMTIYNNRKVIFEGPIGF
jgi:hypothetical protein